MRVTLGLANVDVSHVEDVLDAARRDEVDLLVFPENFSTEPETFGGPLAQHMGEIAQELGAWVVYAARETNPEDGLPFNTAIVINDKGNLVARYRKCHLYDAHGERESDRMAKGNRLFDPVQAPFGRIGLGICYDLRFPEVARHAATNGCDLMLFPAAWHDGPNKLEHWKTLLRARAIENEMFVAGVCLSGERYVNKSYVVDPVGRICAQGSESLVVSTINTSEVEIARDAMPVFDHRRPDLY